MFQSLVGIITLFALLVEIIDPSSPFVRIGGRQEITASLSKYKTITNKELNAKPTSSNEESNKSDLIPDEQVHSSIIAKYFSHIVMPATHQLNIPYPPIYFFPPHLEKDYRPPI